MEGVELAQPYAGGLFSSSVTVLVVRSDYPHEVDTHGAGESHSSHDDVLRNTHTIKLYLSKLSLSVTNQAG